MVCQNGKNCFWDIWRVICLTIWLTWTVEVIYMKALPFNFQIPVFIKSYGPIVYRFSIFAWKSWCQQNYRNLGTNLGIKLNLVYVSTTTVRNFLFLTYLSIEVWAADKNNPLPPRHARTLKSIDIIRLNENDDIKQDSFDTVLMTKATRLFFKSKYLDR